MYPVLSKKEQSKPKEIVTVCAWCHRIKIVTSDFRVYWSKHYSIGPNQVISHTICPSCKERVMANNTELAAVG